MDWLRWHHGTATDPKWRTVAHRSGMPVHAVLAVWALMLESASQAKQRGTLEDWDDEDAGAALDIDADGVTAMREAMQGKTLDGLVLTGWDRRQPQREDSSADRVRAHRERHRDAPETPRDASVTHRNAHETRCNSRGEEIRVEEIRDTPSLRSGDPRAGKPKPAREPKPTIHDLKASDFDEWAKASKLAVDIATELAKAQDWTLANGKNHKDAKAFVRNWMRKAAEMGSALPQIGRRRPGLEPPRPQAADWAR
jgi:hypothetical protein